MSYGLRLAVLGGLLAVAVLALFLVDRDAARASLEGSPDFTVRSGYYPEDSLAQPPEGWDGKGGGWPTPFHVFIHHYKNTPEAPLLDKWEPYLEGYHRHFSRFRGKDVTFVEVGVQSGGSMMMWRWYFGPGLRYIGIDINPQVQVFAGPPWAEIVIGDTGSAEFWRQFAEKHPSADIFLDDGGHTMAQQLAAFRGYYSNVRSGGVFATEDLHTSYMADYGGREDPDAAPAAGEPGATFMQTIFRSAHFLHGHRIRSAEYMARHAADGLLEFLHTTQSIDLHESIVFFDKSAKLAQGPMQYGGGGYRIDYGGAGTKYDGQHYDYAALGRSCTFLKFLAD